MYRMVNMVKQKWLFFFTEPNSMGSLRKICLLSCLEKTCLRASSLCLNVNCTGGRGLADWRYRLENSMRGLERLWPWKPRLCLLYFFNHSIKNKMVNITTKTKISPMSLLCLIILELWIDWPFWFWFCFIFVFYFLICKFVSMFFQLKM